MQDDFIFDSEGVLVFPVFVQWLGDVIKVIRPLINDG